MQTSGLDYKKNSLETFRNSLHRYLRNDCNLEINIFAMPEFKSNKNYSIAMSNIKEAGLGFTKHHNPIAKTDLLKLYDVKYMNPNSPDGLARKVQFDIRYYMCR